jgi:hypothetical protein
LPDNRIELEIRHVVGQGAADEKLHREVIDALGILALVNVLRLHPAPRENVSHRASEGLETLARVGRCRFHDVVEREMTLVERVLASR